MDKAAILAWIKKSASENGGVAPGQEQLDAIGVPKHAWRGKYWRRWNDAVVEAGCTPNRRTEPIEPVALIVRLAELTRRLKRFPAFVDIRMEPQTDKTFPSHNTFYKLGSQAARIECVRAYAAKHEEYRDVLEFLPAADKDAAENAGEAESSKLVDGSVYMLKLGKHYKIGKTFSVPRRHREIALELPEKPDVIHVITTDDPTGIETYWHQRFAAKRTNGEWFALTKEDIRAFMRRKFM